MKEFNNVPIQRFRGNVRASVWQTRNRKASNNPLPAKRRRVDSDFELLEQQANFSYQTLLNNKVRTSSKMRDELLGNSKSHFNCVQIPPWLRFPMVSAQAECLFVLSLRQSVWVKSICRCRGCRSCKQRNRDSRFTPRMWAFLLSTLSSFCHRRVIDGKLVNNPETPVKPHICQPERLVDLLEKYLRQQLCRTARTKM